MFFFNNLPSELISSERRLDDISIIIGENGSGKSTLLNDLSKHFLREGENVIALANSIHDKFDSTHRNFKTLRGRSGRRQTRNILKKALETMAKGDITQNIKSASRVLRYVHFDPVIGFKVDKLSSSYREIIQDAELTPNEKEQIIYLLDRTRSENSNSDIIWLQIEDFNFSELQKSALIELFVWESKLKGLKIIERIEVYLKKMEEKSLCLMRVLEN